MLPRKYFWRRALCVCEFSSSIGSDSFKEKEATSTNCMAKSAKNPGETQHCDIIPEVIQESCEVPPVKVLENFPSSVEGTSENRQGGEPSTERQNMAFETPNDSSASALRKSKDTFDSSWNDEVIYSDVEGPHGFAFEEMSMINPGEADYTVSDNAPVNTSPVVTNADQVITTSQSAPGGIPFTENADVSLHGTKGLEEFKSNHPVNPCVPEKPKGEECETDTLTRSENLRIQPEDLSIGTEVPLSFKLPLKDKTEPQGQTSLVVVKAFPSAKDMVMSKIDPENIKMKDEEVVLGSAQETLESEISRASLPVVDPIVADSVADVSHSDLTGHEGELIKANVVAEENSPSSKLSSESSCTNDQRKSSPETSSNILQIGPEACESNNDMSHAANKAGVVDLFVNESELIQANVVAEENCPISKLSSESSCAVEHCASPVSVELKGGDPSNQEIFLTEETSKDSILQISAEACESNDEDCRESSKGELLEESSTPDDSAKTANQKLLESGRTEFNRVVGGQNSVALSKNQEITMEKTTSWSSVKEQHVPLKNLLSEARSPRLVAAEAKKDHESNIPRVSSILDQQSSPEDGRWPERREVSAEWNSPAKYPVDLKREERKVKERPFWVPFVCCSSVK